MSLSFFINLLNMSIRGSFVIVAVLALRLILGKRSASERMALWALVALRLIVPVSFTSGVSVVPRQVNFLGETAVSAALESVGNTAVTESAKGTDAAMIVLSAALMIWVIGVCAMIAYFAVTTLRLKGLLRESVMIRPGVFACDRIGTPFIFGLWSPRLYVPSFLGGEDLEYVIAHEKTHIRRHDNWWKPAAFVILAMHFFNPLVWVAYFAFCKDLELACDEASTCWKNYEERKAYANALISCSSREHIGACPVAFGGSDVKARVSAILRNAPRKLLVTVILCAAILFCFAAEPEAAMYRHDGLAGEIYGTVCERFADEEMDYIPGKKTWPFVDMQELGYERDGGRITVYLWVLYDLYYYDDGDVVLKFSQREAVRVIAEESGDGGYTVTEYLPVAEEDYGKVFHLSVRSKVVHFDTFAKAQSDANYVEAATTLIPLYERDLDASGEY